ncbi:hypothetical protein Tco_0234131 [Tanacetum coccineum]
METIHVTFNELHQTMAPVRIIVPPGTSLSTTFAQDAPSTSVSPSSSNMQPPVRNQGVGDGPTVKDTPITQDALHPSFNPVTREPGSAQSSSGDVSG